MTDAPAKKDAAVKVHRGEARVEAITKDAITLSHGPITTLEWPPMTMDFKTPATGVPKNVHKGDRVSFEFKLDTNGQAALTGITPQPAGARDGGK
jgi:Cu(I)/Ag(I) efflux system membrane fusion protein